MESNPPPRTIGQRHVNSTAFQSVVDQVENAPEAGRCDATDETGSRREAPVGPNQMLSS